MGSELFGSWSIVLAVAIGELSTSKWLWEWLAGDFTEVLGALSSEAVGGFACLSNLGSLGVCDLLVGIVFTVYSNVLSRDNVCGTLGSTVFGLLVISVPVESVVFLLELVVGSSGRLRLSLRSGADLTVALTIVFDARAVKLACNWCFASSTALSWANFDGGGYS